MDEPQILALTFIAFVSFAMSYLGASVGLVLGHLRVALLTYVLGSASVGVATSLAISTVAGIAGAFGHARGGRVRLEPLLTIGVPSALAASAATRYAGLVDPRWLKLAIAVALLATAVNMLRGRRTPDALGPSPPSTSLLGGALKIAVGTVLGAVAGLVGLMLGSLRLPALVRLGVSPAAAVGTNMAIGAITGLAAGMTAVGGGKVNIVAFAVVCPLTLVGTHLGAQKTGKLDPLALTRWIAYALGATALLMFCEISLGRVAAATVARP